MASMGNALGKMHGGTETPRPAVKSPDARGLQPPAVVFVSSLRGRKARRLLLSSAQAKVRGDGMERVSHPRTCHRQH